MRGTGEVEAGCFFYTRVRAALRLRSVLLLLCCLTSACRGFCTCDLHRNACIMAKIMQPCNNASTTHSSRAGQA